MKSHNINNMITFMASHFKNYTHAPNNETHKIMDDVITLETNNLLNNDGKQMKEVGSFQENYDKYHIELNNVEI